MIDIVCIECSKVTSGICGLHSSYTITYPCTITYEGIFPEKKPYKCPVCSGSGKVSRPPHLAGDVNTWSSSNAEPYPCHSCKSTGIIWG